MNIGPFFSRHLKVIITMYNIIIGPMVIESSALFTPRVSKLKPNDAPSYYARLLANAATIKHPAWKELEQFVRELGEQHFGKREFEGMLKSGSFRSPIRYDVVGKGYPDDVEAFLNVKAGADYPPVVVGRDAAPIMDKSEVYPGCIVRVSLRAFCYGGRGTNFGAGISLGLVNVQKLADGPRLKSARGNGSEFGAVGGDDLDSLIK
jgi:hypothetical protein